MKEFKASNYLRKTDMNTLADVVNVYEKERGAFATNAERIFKLEDLKDFKDFIDLYGLKTAIAEYNSGCHYYLGGCNFEFPMAMNEPDLLKIIDDYYTLDEMKRLFNENDWWESFLKRYFVVDFLNIKEFSVTITFRATYDFDSNFLKKLENYIENFDNVTMSIKSKLEENK